MQLDPAPYLLDGAWVPGPSTSDVTVLEVRDPRDDALVGRIPVGGPADVDAAVAGAVKAATGWARTSPGERSSLLKAAARELRERFPARFATWEEALTRVGRLSEEYADPAAR